MPENGTSLIRDTFNPVINPPAPSYKYIFRAASIIELYSLNPTTSNLVLIIIIGLLKTLYTIRAIQLAEKCTYPSLIILSFLMFSSKKYKLEKKVPEVMKHFKMAG